MIKKIFSVTCALILIVAFVQSLANAEDISVQAEINRPELVLGEVGQLTITVAGTQDAEPASLPVIDGVTVKYIGPSRQISIVNGHMSSSIAFNYSIFPQKVGTFEIPALEVTSGGEAYKTQPISLTVVSSADSNDSGRAQAGSPVTSLQDKIFLRLKVAKDRVYLNEKVPVKIFLYVNGMAARDIQYPKLANLGVTQSDYSKPNQFQQVINGIRYDIVEFDSYLYPTRPGELTLGPATLDCNILVPKSSSRSMGGRFDSIFTDDFFQDFFDFGQKQPISVSSNDLKLTVLPLPDEGKSEDFRGAVGNFDFDVSVSPTDVKEGDPITLRMKISGDGNLQAVDFPKLPQNDQLKLYDPSIKEVNGTKTYEQVVIPKTSDISELPAITFSFFNPGAGKYEAISQGPFPVHVTPVSEEERSKIIGLKEPEVVAPKPEKLGEDIIFIKDQPGQLFDHGRHLYNSPYFYFLLVILIGAWCASLAYLQKTFRLQTDTRYARKMLAPKNAQQGLAMARGFMEEGKTSEFYDLLDKTLKKYFADKFHLPIGTITMGQLRSNPASSEALAAVMDDLHGVFDESEQARFASIQFDPQKMKAAFEKTVRIIDAVERAGR